MKITHNKKTRQDISNPFNELSHEELLKKASVYKFINPKIVHLDNGKIMVEEQV